MRLLSSRIEYVASVLPTTPLNDSHLSARIFDLMQTENRSGRPLFHQSVQVVEGFQRYLRRQSQEFLVHPGFADRQRSGSGYILGKLQDALTYARRENAAKSAQADLLDM
jgi:hypothetical protein